LVLFVMLVRVCISLRSKGHTWAGGQYDVVSEDKHSCVALADSHYDSTTAAASSGTSMTPDSDTKDSLDDTSQVHHISATTGACHDHGIAAAVSAAAAADSTAAASSTTAHSPAAANHARSLPVIPTIATAVVVDDDDEFDDEIGLDDDAGAGWYYGGVSCDK
jgi:hypothetical protein